MSKKTDASENLAETVAGDDTVVAAQGDGGLEGAEAGDELDKDDPAVTGIPRDETHDSIDRHTGTLTEDAVAKRAGVAE